MKILLFSSKYPPKTGGVENVVYNLSKEFRNKGETILIVTSLELNASKFLSKIKEGFRISQSESKEVWKVFMSIPRSIFGLISFPYRFPVSILQIRNKLKKFKPDIINVHFPDDAVYYLYFSLLFNKTPLFINIHGNEVHLFSKKWFYRLFLSRLIKKSKKIIVNSKYMQKELLKVYPEATSKIIILRNGVDITFFRKLEFNTKNKNNYYLYVGRFDNKKGLDILIKAFNNISSKIKRDLYIIGAPVEMGETQKYYDNLVKSNKIKFLGKKIFPELAQYYKNAFYSIFPSRIEPFGIVALESLACGTPVISSKTGGFKEIALNTQGIILFKRGSVKALSNLLLKLDKQEAKREALSKNGLKNIQYYNWNHISKDYLNLFKQIK